MKRITTVILVLILMTVCCSCGKGKKEKGGEQSTPEQKSPVNAVDEYDPDKDIYVYPEGDWGEGFNYGTVRGRWRADYSYTIEDLPEGNTQSIQHVVKILKAMNKELPPVEYRVMMRFIDESHMEGRLTIDTRALRDLVLELFGTEEGILSLYGALYGYSKNEVAYIIRQQGLTVEELAATVRRTLEVQGGGEEAFIASEDLRGTYTLADNNVLFVNLKYDMEYNPDADTLTIHLQDDYDGKYDFWDGLVLTRG